MVNHETLFFREIVDFRVNHRPKINVSRNSPASPMCVTSQCCGPLSLKRDT